MLPNFIIVGAAKCGTTSLCTLLGQHDNVFVSEPKEPHYFGRNDPDKTQSWYEAHFDAAVSEKAVGEGNTSYTKPDIVQQCASEISALIPNVRLIYMVRNPLERIESDWKMRKHEGWAADGPIENEVMRDELLITQGMYWRNLSHYRHHFNDEQILVVFLEDFATGTTKEMGRCFSHIGVSPNVELVKPGKKRNSSSDFRRDRRLGRWMRELGLVDVARDMVPRSVWRLGKRMLTERDQYSVNWDPHVKRKVAQRLEPDARRFLEYCGKPKDYWDLNG
jgi:hypothetical protein